MTILSDRYVYLASIRNPKKRLEAARAWDRLHPDQKAITEAQFQKLSLSDKIKLVPGL